MSAKAPQQGVPVLVGAPMTVARLADGRVLLTASQGAIAVQMLFPAEGARALADEIHAACSPIVKPPPGLLSS